MCYRLPLALHRLTLFWNGVPHQAYIHNELDVSVIGPAVDLTYDYDHLGDSAAAVAEAGAKALKGKTNAMIVCGSHVFERADGDAIFAAIQELGASTGATVNVLHTSAGQVAALDIGYKGGVPASKAKFVWLLGAESVPSAVTDGAFVVYQGHHGDAGAASADVVLPGAAYTEKVRVSVFSRACRCPTRHHRPSFQPSFSPSLWSLPFCS